MLLSFKLSSLKPWQVQKYIFFNQKPFILFSHICILFRVRLLCSCSELLLTMIFMKDSHWTSVSRMPFCFLSYERYWDRHGLPWNFRFPTTLNPRLIFELNKLQIPLKPRTTSAYNWDLAINVPVETPTMKICESHELFSISNYLCKGDHRYDTLSPHNSTISSLHTQYLIA